MVLQKNCEPVFELAMLETTYWRANYQIVEVTQ